MISDSNPKKALISTRSQRGTLTVSLDFSVISRWIGRVFQLLFGGLYHLVVTADQLLARATGVAGRWVMIAGLGLGLGFGAVIAAPAQRVNALPEIIAPVSYTNPVVVSIPDQDFSTEISQVGEARFTDWQVSGQFSGTKRQVVTTNQDRELLESLALGDTIQVQRANQGTYPYTVTQIRFSGQDQLATVIESTPDTSFILMHLPILPWQDAVLIIGQTR